MLVRFRPRGGGPERVSEVSAIPVRAEGGDVVYVIGLFVEVTREFELAGAQRSSAERAEQLYREAARTSALLDALYGSAPVGLGFWDTELRYVRVNEALARINQRPAEDHVGRSLDEVVPQLAHVLAPIARRVLETGEPVLELEMAGGTPLDPDAERFWRASYYPVFGPDGEALGVGAVVEELTDRRRAERRTELQLAVTSILTAAETVEDAVRGVLRLLCSELDWDVAAFWPVEPDRSPRTYVRRGLSFEGFVAATEGSAASPESLPARVARARRAAWLEELVADVFPRAADAAAEGLTSGVVFPAAVDGDLVGVLEVFSRARRRHDPALEQTLTGLAGQLAQFIRRKRVEEDRVQLLESERRARAEAEAAAATLRKLGRVSEVALEHVSLDDMLRSLLARIVDVLDADTATILLVGEDGHLHVRASLGLEAELDRALAIPVGAGLAGRVAASRSPLLVPDLTQVELVSPVLRERGINSVVAIPFTVEDRVIGVLHAGSEAFAQFVEEDARLLELIADRVALAINQAALYDAEREAQERLQFLADASTLLASSLDVEATFERIAQLAVPQFADWCAVDLVGDGGRLEPVAVAHLDPAKVEVGRRIAAGSRASIHDELGLGAVVRSGAPSLLAAIDEQALREVYGGRPDLLDDLLGLGLSSTMVVPLVLRDEPLGAIAFAWAESGRRYGPGDLRFVQELASRAAVAVENTRLYRAAGRRRDQLGFLVEASALLGASLDVDRTLERLGALVAGRIADWCAIHLASEPGTSRLVSLAHRDPSRAAAVTARLLDDPSLAELLGVGTVIDTGAPQFQPAISPEPTGGEAALRSCIVVPLEARGRVFGAMTLVWAETDESYDEDDLDFVLDLALRAGDRDRQRAALRAPPRSAPRRRACSPRSATGCSCSTTPASCVPGTRPRPPRPVWPLRTCSTGRPSRRSAGWAAVAAPRSRSSRRAAPSRVPSRYRSTSGGRELWLSIHGVAVPDGAVYAFRDLTEERALEQMRNEFVSTVSHELRTPLAAIYGAAMTLRRGDVDARRVPALDAARRRLGRGRPPRPHRQRHPLGEPARHRLAPRHDPGVRSRRARARGGRARSRRTSIRGTRSSCRSTTASRLVAGDPDKVSRILINLVDNAVKYSPDGGRVSVRLRRSGAHVCVRGEDQGLGIPPAEQRRVFEKFYRLDPNMNRGVGGTGLGLYICRELVRRMDGRIWVESAGLGTGSTFHIELPPAAGSRQDLRTAFAGSAGNASLSRVAGESACGKRGRGLRPVLDGTGRYSARGALLDGGRGAAAVRSAEAAPARPEHERQDDADPADDHQDDPDRVDVEAGRGRVDRPGEDRTRGDQDQTDSDTHGEEPPSRTPDVGGRPADVRGCREINVRGADSVTTRAGPAGAEDRSPGPGVSRRGSSRARLRGIRSSRLRRGCAGDRSCSWLRSRWSQVRSVPPSRS